MKNYKLYSYVSLFFVLVYTCLLIVMIPILLKRNTIQVVNSVAYAIKKETTCFSALAQEVSPNKFNRQDYITLVQRLIEKQNDYYFLSIIDWTGSYVCYPDITKVGQVAASEKLITKSNNELEGVELYTHFLNLKNEGMSDIGMITLEPIPNSDLIIASYLNLNTIITLQNNIKQSLYITFLVLGLFLFLVILGMVRFISSFYSKQLDKKVAELEYNASNLAQLNKSIVSYQQNLSKIEQKTVENDVDELDSVTSEKERFLTYVRNELVSISANEIAYIYVEHTITYIIRKDGKLATSNDSLDKIYAALNKKLFFRANRQFVIAITAIDKITKFENSKLKIQVNPLSEIDIIIGKNKASAFKQWLDL